VPVGRVAGIARLYVCIHPEIAMSLPDSDCLRDNLRRPVRAGIEFAFLQFGGESFSNRGREVRWLIEGYGVNDDEFRLRRLCGWL
jgi:hypothetical protein